jgi:RNA polymerase sigma-70 factor (ECF subfamily)
MPNAQLAVMTYESSTPEFDTLFREHHRLLYRTAFGITGSSADAEDVVQTIFLRLLGREFPPDLKKNPRAYLYRAAVNGSLNTIRSKRRQVQLLEAEALPSPNSDADPDSDADTRKRLLDAISELNTKAVEILMLRYVHGYSDAEIAKMLGTTRGTVAVNLFRMRARLKKLIRTAGEKL